MKPFSTLTLLVIVLLSFVCLPSQAQTKEPSTPLKYPNYPSETPDNLKPATATFDYERREVMVPKGTSPCSGLEVRSSESAVQVSPRSKER